MTNKVEQSSVRGQFIVTFYDGLNDLAFYDHSLDYVIHMLAKQVPYREVKSIEWVEANWED